MTKIIIMQCPVCKETFNTEYWEGGYIDHVCNWVGNYDKTLNKLQINPNYLIEFIDDLTTHNNIYSSIKNIISKKDCFFKWLDSQNVDLELKEKIENALTERLTHIEEINKEIANVKSILDKYTDYKDRRSIIDSLIA